jgi:hypothetical protein
MKILHITPETNGYEVVELLANAINRTNNLAMIEKNGQKFMSGGFLINDTPRIRKILDAIPKDEQLSFIKEFKMDPFETFYYDEIKNKDESL